MKKHKLNLQNLKVTSFITKQSSTYHLLGGKRRTEWCTRDPNDGACSLQNCHTPPTESCDCYPESEIHCTDTIEDVFVTVSDALLNCNC